MNTSRAAAVAVALTIALAGCGGSSNKELSYSGYISKLNALCKRGEAEFTKVQSPKEAEPIIDKYEKKFKDLKPPKELKAQHDRFVAITEEQRAALERNDIKKFNQLNADSNKVAAEIGAKECISE